MGSFECSQCAIRYSLGAADTRRIRGLVVELVALAPEVILAVSNPVVVELQQVSSTIPIVFAAVADP